MRGCGRVENGGGEPRRVCARDASAVFAGRWRGNKPLQGVSRRGGVRHDGGATPEEAIEAIAGLMALFFQGRFGFHGHTDRGLGEANTRAAILAGAVQVQGTLIGTGERCGNVNLTTVVWPMQVRGEAGIRPLQTALNAGPRPSRTRPTVRSCLRCSVPHGAPIVGPGAFGTWAGMHGSSEKKNPGAYLWCDPSVVGATPAIGVNGQSGRATLFPC